MPALLDLVDRVLLRQPLARTKSSRRLPRPLRNRRAPAPPSEDSLRKLDTLRQSLAELTDYEYNGAPLHLRWGLYSGSSVLPSVRRVYYSKFNQLLFGGTEAGILAFPPTHPRRSRPH